MVRIGAGAKVVFGAIVTEKLSGKMGYEPITPPVPTREEEIEMIEKIEDDFLNQSSLKHFMNESRRL